MRGRNCLTLGYPTSICTKPTRRSELRGAVLRGLGGQSEHAINWPSSGAAPTRKPVGRPHSSRGDNAVNQLVAPRPLEKRGADRCRSHNALTILGDAPSAGFAYALMDVQMPEMEVPTPRRSMKNVPGNRIHTVAGSSTEWRCSECRIL